MITITLVQGLKVIGAGTVSDRAGNDGEPIVELLLAGTATAEVMRALDRMGTVIAAHLEAANPPREPELPLVKPVVAPDPDTL